ncbi:metallophosphoesterase [Fibrella sp. HMF5335]|uniref:Metallophosphoesterase n=1 Tax=Fibrella rubiginis TaxID=2817060 RepID=A0A939GL26_9BACT|nr:metallophosphoesterase [Fibrella rubiginis]MBO0939838.1 metallophosphoesterase [Fibrella rubiginis]
MPQRILVLLFVLGTFPGFVFAQAITRGPYLQRVTPTGVTVRWRTDVPTDSRVRYGAGLSQQAVDNAQTTEHIVVLTGLQPATRYTYAVGTSKVDLSPANDASYAFKTAPAFGSNEAVRVWVLGDFGAIGPRQDQAFSSYKAATKNQPPDLWVWLGDNAYSYGRDDEYQRNVFDYYPEQLRSLPFYATPGNHDYHDDVNDFNVPYFALTTPPTNAEAGGVASKSTSYYSVDYGPLHLISLDSYGNFPGQGRIFDTTSTQIEWLKRDLAANAASAKKRPWTVIFFHHPPYTQGSRNSDTEQDLILNRARLTPIFERYNVDLVLSGHSHIYERTYQIRNHRDLSATFNKRTMATDTSTGRYDGSANSCPIVQKDGSLIYIVNGSGGALGGRAPNYPHKAMVYSYTDEGGSMLFDVAENRLDAQWLAPSGVKDRFTLVKNVNRRQTITAEYGDTLTLRASWPGEYNWSGGQTGRTIRTVNQSGTFRVTDGKNCLADEYQVTALPKPRFVTNALSAAAYCPGTAIALSVTPENTTKANAWTYTVELSDASGSFTSPVVVGSGSLATLIAKLPANLPGGAGYRLRVVPQNVPYAEAVASPAFTVQQPATATLSAGIALVGQPTTATVTLGGNGPWRGTFSDGTSFSATSSPALVTLPASQPGSIRLTQISGACGAGTVQGAGEVLVQQITATEPNLPAVTVFPNPTTGQIWVELEVPGPEAAQIDLFNQQGTRVANRRVAPAPTRQRLPFQLDKPGIYVVRIQIGAQTVSHKVIRQ